MRCKESLPTHREAGVKSEIMGDKTLVAQERYKLVAFAIAIDPQRIDGAQRERRPIAQQRLRTCVKVDPDARHKHSAARVYSHRWRTGCDAPRAVQAARYSLNYDLNRRLSHAALRTGELRAQPLADLLPVLNLKEPDFAVRA